MLQIAEHSFTVVGQAILVVAAICTIAGCSDDPKTFPVFGKVVFEDGSVAAHGIIEFRSQDYADIIATAEIDENGEFSGARTYVDGKQIPDVVAGTHQVTIVRGLEEDGSDPQTKVATISIAETQTIKPGKNRLKIVVPNYEQ